MPTPDRLIVHYNRKIQLERYEPVDHGATLEIDLDEDDDWRDVYDEYADAVEDEVERELARRVAATKLGPDAEDGD